MRPIFLTSCIGKVLEHVLNNRWQRYLEEKGLYPDSMLGFRERLSTQDAMIQLQHEILERPTTSHDNRAVLGLYLQSAFDKVRHSAILAQVSEVGLGKSSHDYIRDFLSHRTLELQAGDLELPERELGSVGHTIYADYITLWGPGGSDGHIESSLQEAIAAIEQQLAGTGLKCSPQKSKLLVIPPPGRYRKRAEEEASKIKLFTCDGTEIPRVSKLRVLGMLLEANGGNGATVERRSERNRINAAIRKTYNAALGLLNRTSTQKLLELGVHNTLEEIGKSQRASQLERLQTT
ncbi:uncharacterized protein LOC144160720 [Haemaphysalis longicornis]